MKRLQHKAARRRVPAYALLVVITALGCEAAEPTVPTEPALAPASAARQLAEPCGEATEVRLLAGQHHDVGRVVVENDGETLLVRYTATSGWISETHLSVVADPSEFPTTRKGQPKPGRFARSGEHAVGTTEVEYEYALADLGVEADAVVWIAAHAVVGRETAWGEGTEFTERGGWAMYFEHTVQSCGVTPPPPPPPPEPTCDAPAYAYAANQGNGQEVTVVELGTPSVLTTLTAGLRPFGAATTPDGSEVWITNRESNSVSVIDVGTNTITATLTGMGVDPFDIAFTPDGATAYLGDNDDAMRVIDVATRTVTTTIGDLAAFRRGLDVTPSGDAVYVAADDTLHRIETATNTVTHDIVGPTGELGDLHYVAVSPDGEKVYVTDNAADRVRVVSTATNTLVTDIPVGNEPAGIAIRPLEDGYQVLVANYRGGNLSVIEDDAVVGTISTGSDPWGVVVSCDGSTAYVTRRISGTGYVTIVDLATETATSLEAGSFPSGIAIAPAPDS